MFGSSHKKHIQQLQDRVSELENALQHSQQQLRDSEQARQQAWEGADEAGRRVLEAWQLHARQLQEHYSIG